MSFEEDFMTDKVLIRYREFLKNIEKGNISEMNIDGSHDFLTGLDFVGVYPVNGRADFYFELNPYSNNEGSILSALELCKNDSNIVSRKDLVEKVLPEISPLVSKALAERNDPTYNEDLSSNDYKPKKRNDILSLMEAVEQNSDIKLDYNWGL